MNQVCLQFESLVALTDFLSIIQNVNCEINRQRLTVICEITDKEPELATETFGASVVNQQR